MMKQSSLQFQISQLRQEKLIYALESIAVFLFSLFLTAFLPQILFRYFYANQQLLEQPKTLEYLPVAAFAIGVGFFIFAMVKSVMIKMQIAKLEKELALVGESCDCCEDGMCACDHHEGHDHAHMMSEMAEPTWEETSKKTASASAAALAQKMKTVNQKKKTKSRK